ncbi:nuclear transport factor 2 family protein [Octadecabacter ascidiaceicola]|uniref:Putative lumazine-binding protein n=1 Tax=Octadecabacter ascidiaceicola TaxID=1655543 RepID=A0A238K5V5_9RHOB|nr:nuclear transport factor 2 family protein [Octadecabacter ascidiaceicola]SMX38290.1 Putative lumazine-binding protein [Octadecabacter ascidiaceicola]
MTPQDFSEVSSLMQSYFDGLYHADSDRLREVFHPKLAYICATEGDELYLDLDTYMARIDQREAPAKRNEPRKDTILEISFGSARLAHVTARMTMMGRDYLDHLTLVRHGSEWRVVTKAFAYLPQED